jgi:hypothetical protein
MEHPATIQADEGLPYGVKIKIYLNDAEDYGINLG